MSIDHLNHGFQPPAILSSLTGELIGVLNDLCAVSSLMNISKESLPLSGPISMDTIVNCEESLMMLSAQRKAAPPFLEIPDIQECTCLAAELYLVRIIRKYPISTYGGPLTSKDLLAALSRLLVRDDHEQYLHLMLWVAFMGSLATETIDCMREWPIMISRIAMEVRIRSWSEVRSILIGFLWLGPCADLMGETTWAQVESLLPI